MLDWRGGQLPTQPLKVVTLQRLTFKLSGRATVRGGSNNSMKSQQRTRFCPSMKNTVPMSVGSVIKGAPFVWRNLHFAWNVQGGTREKGGSASSKPTSPSNSSSMPTGGSSKLHSATLSQTFLGLLGTSKGNR